MLHSVTALYFCTEEPTWKLISLSVPPMNLPLIRLPFFSSKESAHARDAPSHRAMTNPQFTLNFTLTSPLQRSCFLRWADPVPCVSSDQDRMPNAYSQV